MKRETVLVVGGAGYIGSHTARLLSEDFDVVVYDDLSRGHEWAAGYGDLVRGSIFDEQRLVDLMTGRGVVGVFHFAAHSLVGESVEKPLDYWWNNVAGSRVLLSAMRRCGVDRIVFSSTAAVYGEPEDMPITEDFPRAPTNPYGVTKAAVEDMLSHCASAFGLRYASLRYFNAAGASLDGEIGEDHDPETHLVPIALDAALGRRTGLKIFGDDYPTEDGTCVRDYIHVVDLADAHARAFRLLRNGESGLVLNLGTGRGFSVREVVDMVRKVTGSDFAVDVVERRAGDPPRLVAASDRARTMLDWKPRFSDLEQIVSTAWNWHRRHFA